LGVGDDCGLRQNAAWRAFVRSCPAAIAPGRAFGELRAAERTDLAATLVWNAAPYGLADVLADPVEDFRHQAGGGGVRVDAAVRGNAAHASAHTVAGQRPENFLKSLSDHLDIDGATLPSAKSRAGNPNRRAK
jgi:hypothetical protein